MGWLSDTTVSGAKGELVKCTVYKHEGLTGKGLGCEPQAIQPSFPLPPHMKIEEEEDKRMQEIRQLNRARDITPLNAGALCVHVQSNDDRSGRYYYILHTQGSFTSTRFKVTPTLLHFHFEYVPL